MKTTIGYSINRSAALFFCILIFLAEIHAQSVSFVSNVYTGCPSLKVSFTNTSPAGTTFKWRIEKEVYTTFNASHVFNTAGSHRVELFAYDSKGKHAGYTYSYIYIYGSIGDFYMSHSTVCPNTEIKYGSWENANSYLWSFGDGTYATSSYTQHSYSLPGIYDVGLIINTLCGIDTVIKQVEVRGSMSPPNFSFYAKKPVCPGETVNFKAKRGYSYRDDNDLSFHWDFGDGTSLTGKNQYHSFSDLGSYDVTLSVYNGCGLSSSYTGIVFVADTNSISVPAFSAWPKRGCSSTQLQFYHSYWRNYTSVLWDFGDGTTDTTLRPLHTFPASGNYFVKLKITNSCGNSNSYSEKIAVSDTIVPLYPPYFEFISDTICPGDKLFQIPWYADEDPAMWDFGDGTQFTGSAHLHFYKSTGIYPVTKTITSSCGYSASYTDTVVVTKSGIPLIPYLDNYEACPGDSIKFQPYIPIPYTYGQRRSYSYYMLIWDFGDGTADTTYNDYSYHAYAAIGRYDVKVTAINGCGNSSSFTGQVSIVNNSIPYAYLWWPSPVYNNFYSACEKIEFTTENWYRPAANVKYSYEWDFGDGNTLMTKSTSATHSFNNPGTYTIGLIVSNNCGNRYAVKRDIAIKGVCTGIGSEFFENENAINVLIYPNPFSISATIELNVGLRNAAIIIYNLFGKEVKRIENIQSSPIAIERGNLHAGMYFYEIVNNKKRIGTGKLIVQ